MTDIPGVELTPLKIIEGAAGRVMHAMQASENQNFAFGEIYFSTINKSATKGWKRHRHMVLNILVAHGAIRFFLYKDQDNLRGHAPVFCVVELGPRVNYQRLTVPPGVWMAFHGMAEGESVLMNIASIPHCPSEADTLPLDDPRFQVFHFFSSK